MDKAWYTTVQFKWKNNHSRAIPLAAKYILIFCFYNWKCRKCDVILMDCATNWLGAFIWDNIKRKTGRAEGQCCQIKNIKFLWDGELHRRAGRQAAQQGRPVGCTLGRAGGLHIKLAPTEKGGLPFSATRRTVFCAARRPALLSSVHPASPPKVHVFHLETRPAGPPISVILLFVSGYRSAGSDTA